MRREEEGGGVKREEETEEGGGGGRRVTAQKGRLSSQVVCSVFIWFLFEQQGGGMVSKAGPARARRDRKRLLCVWCFFLKRETQRRLDPTARKRSQGSQGPPCGGGLPSSD